MADMATTIAAIQDAIEIEMPSKTRLHNPYVFEDNSNVFLRDGYGVVIGTGSENPLQEFSHSYDDITIGIVLTKEVIANDHDVNAINNSISELYEESRVLRALFLKQFPTGVIKVDYSNTTGVVVDTHVASITINFTMTFITAL